MVVLDKICSPLHPTNRRARGGGHKVNVPGVSLDTVINAAGLSNKQATALCIPFYARGHRHSTASSHLS